MAHMDPTTLKLRRTGLNLPVELFVLILVITEVLQNKAGGPPTL